MTYSNDHPTMEVLFKVWYNLSLLQYICNKKEKTMPASLSWNFNFPNIRYVECTSDMYVYSVYQNT